MEKYVPPFRMTEEITNLVIEIGEYVGRVAFYESLHPNPVQQRENRIRSIHFSLAIEQNSLTLHQVTDVIDGKRVLGPPQDIQEVKNAYKAYELAAKLDPYQIDDLWKIHKIMMDGFVKEAGVFRHGNVGIYAGARLMHMGPPAGLVPELMKQLFAWLQQSSYHPLVKSCIFHYEFEFIHPFADGNGRTGRLWQSLILRKWKELFAWMPVETLVHENQKAYYHALQQADHMGESTVFVAFMLGMIRDALRDVARNVGVNVGVNETRILELLAQNGHLTANTLASTLGCTFRQVQRILATLKQKRKLIRHGAPKNGWREVPRVER